MKAVAKLFALCSLVAVAIQGHAQDFVPPDLIFLPRDAADKMFDGLDDCIARQGKTPDECGSDRYDASLVSRISRAGKETDYSGMREEQDARRKYYDGASEDEADEIAADAQSESPSATFGDKIECLIGSNIIRDECANARYEASVDYRIQDAQDDSDYSGLREEQEARRNYYDGPPDDESEGEEAYNDFMAEFGGEPDEASTKLKPQRYGCISDKKGCLSKP